jgi:hypothetical protein
LVLRTKQKSKANPEFNDGISEQLVETWGALFDARCWVSFYD